MEEWKEYKLKDVTSLITKGTTPSMIGAKFTTHGIKFIKSECILENTRLLDSTKYTFISPETNERLKRSQIIENDILFSMAGIFLGKTGIATKSDVPANTNQAVAIIRIIPEKADFKYVYYFLNQKKLITYINGISAQSAQPNINLQQIGDLSIKLPPLPTQQKIAAILSSLDDKIELNNKITNNLEQQAQALFKNCFVNENNTNSFSLKQLEDVTVNLRERITNQNTPVLSAVNTGKLQRSDEYFSKQVYSKDISKYILVKKGDFAYNPARVNIGSIGINDLGYDGCVSPVYVAFSVDPDYRSFFKYFIKSNKFKEEAKTRATGSVRQTLNYSDFAKIEIKYPPRDLAKQFEAFHSTIEASKRKIEKETETLISIRDTLLPKLMTGEIEV